MNTIIAKINNTGKFVYNEEKYSLTLHIVNITMVLNETEKKII